MSLRVALVGKPNVGKSTLFNRILAKRKAIVSDIPGTTRDRIYGDCQWLNKSFKLIDTGGLTNKVQPFKVNIEQQVNFALDEAHVIIFLVSYKDGVDANDQYVAKILRKYKSKNIIVVANKAENKTFEGEQVFYQLGFGKPLCVSAEHGIGIGDLLDAVIKKMSNFETKVEAQDHVKFCIIGRTNVGKSTLMNAVLGKERTVVSSIEHTTRDSINEDFYRQKELYTIIDTAGIRRKGHVTDQIEKYAVLRTQIAIEESNLILFVIDVSEPFNEQDEVIGGLAWKANIPTIIIVNKWDTVKKETMTMKKIETEIRKRFKYLSYAPIVFISAKDKTRIDVIFTTIKKIQAQLKTKVNTQMLNNVVAKAQLANPSPKNGGGRLSISYATQVKSQIPSFVLFVNKPDYLHFTYARYIENQIRTAFGIDSVPILVYYKDKNARIRTEN